MHKFCMLWCIYDPSAKEKQMDKHGLFKKKQGKITRALDDSSVEALNKAGGPKLRRQSSETNLASDFLGVSNKDGRGQSKPSLIEKFADVSKAISHQQAGKSKGKSPFKMFKKPKKGEQPGVAMFPEAHKTMPSKMPSGTPSEYSEESDTESLVTGPMLSLQDHRHQHSLQAPAHTMKKSPSMASYESAQQESDVDTQDLEMDMDLIDEYYYGIRIFPGQDPTQVYVGWVTPQFHMFNTEFDMKKVRNVVVCSLDANFQLKSR